MDQIIAEIAENLALDTAAVEELNLSELALVGGGSASMIFA